MADTSGGDGLLRWLLGGLAVGLVVLGLVIAAYAVGHSRGEDAARQEATTPVATTPIPTTPTETTETETTPTTPTETTETQTTTTQTTETETTPTTTEEDLVAQGKQVFASAGCGGCHTLADAGSTGSVGPKLDGLGVSPDLVVDRVTNGRGVMPPFEGQLTPDEIQAVAAYVSQASAP
jgi:cytochrome c553